METKIKKNEIKHKTQKQLVIPIQIVIPTPTTAIYPLISINYFTLKIFQLSFIMTSIIWWSSFAFFWPL